VSRLINVDDSSLFAWFSCADAFVCPGVIGPYQMAGSSGGSTDLDSQSDESYQFERLRVEPHFTSFVCPLTKQVMRDPVTIENGNTFEREAIEKWFRECEASGKRPTCPLTKQDLKSLRLNPSIALRKTIEEWADRNEAAQLDMARRALSTGTLERDILQSLKYVEYISKGSRSNKHAVHNAEIVHLIIDMLRNGSRKVRFKALQTLQVIAEQDSDMKVIPSLVFLIEAFYSVLFLVRSKVFGTSVKSFILHAGNNS